MNEVVTVAASALAIAASFAKEALSPATQRAYRSDWQHFTGWCHAAGIPALPAAPQTVAAYVGSMALSHSRATIRRRLAAIGQAHGLRGCEWIPSHPVIRNTLRGMFRRHGTPQRKAAAFDIADIRQLVATCQNDLAGLRDRAILLLGFAGALRRAELAAIQRENLTFVNEGARLLIARAKGDQEGEGVEIGIPRGDRRDTCPIRALEAWLAASGCHYGPIFRKVNMWGTVEREALHPSSIATIVKKRAMAAGLKVGSLERLSSHGLRAGFVTEAYKAGARDEQIMGHTRHRDLKTMRGYVRRAKLMSENPAKLIGL